MKTVETVTDFIFGGVPKSPQMVTAAMKLKDACSQKKSYDQPGQHIKKQKHYFATKVYLVKAMVFPLDQRLSAARSASINDFISTFQPLDQRLSAA